MGNTPNIGRWDIAGYNFETINLNATVGSELTPLCIFVVKGNYKTQIEILAKRGADFNVMDSFFNTPLHYAAEKRTDLVSLLIDLGVHKCLQNKRGETPLHIAVKNQRYDYIRSLSDAMFIKDNEGKGPIHYAIEQNDVEMIQLLVVNTPSLPILWISSYTLEPLDYHLNYFANNDGLTPLSLAIFEMKEKSIIALSNHGANPKIKYKNKSPNDYIVEISRSLVYGKDQLQCKENDVLKIYSIINHETDVHRNVYGESTIHTGLLSNY